MLSCHYDTQGFDLGISDFVQSQEKMRTETNGVLADGQVPGEALGHYLHPRYLGFLSSFTTKPDGEDSSEATHLIGFQLR